MDGNVTFLKGGAGTAAGRGIRIERPKKSLRDLVQDAMREAILDMRFAPGERLVERALCAELGVSRTVVREVLRFLEAEGLVEITANGPAVATIRTEDAEQIYEIREQLEGMAAAACAEHAATGDLSMLHQAMRDLVTAKETDDPRLSLRATSRFYQTVFAVSGKHVAWAVVESLYARINALRAMTIRTSDRQVVSVNEMQAIYDAIVAGDADAARAAAVEHVRQAAATARRLLAEPQAEATPTAPESRTLPGRP